MHGLLGGGQVRSQMCRVPLSFTSMQFRSRCSSSFMRVSCALTCACTAWNDRLSTTIATLEVESAKMHDKTMKKYTTFASFPESAPTNVPLLISHFILQAK